MTKLSHLFTVAHRFNTLTITTALVSIIGFGSYSLLRSEFREPKRSIVAPSSASTDAGEILRLRRSNLRPPEGQLVFSVVSRKPNEYESNAEEKRNLLFVATGTDEVRWLFPGQGQVLDTLDQAPEGGRFAGTIYIESRPSINGSDRRDDVLTTISLARPDGSTVTEVVSGVAEILDRQWDHDSLRVIYQKADSVRMASIRLDDFKVHADRQIAGLRDAGWAHRQ